MIIKTNSAKRAFAAVTLGVAALILSLFTAYAPASAATRRTLTYSSNGGSGGGIERVEAGARVTIKHASELRVERRGYSFEGWNTRPDGRGRSYRPGTTTIIEDDLRLYAQWRNGSSVSINATKANDAKYCTLNYNANGGTGGVAERVRRGGRVTLKHASSLRITRSGYEFIGWGIKKNGQGTSYGAGSVIEINEDLRLYALWRRR